MVPRPLHFNSIKVRLKLNQGTFSFDTREQFQFHKGTIKTLHQILHLLLSIIFQFHKGTIKTAVADGKMTLKEYFNSIKVRLKRPGDYYCRYVIY